MRATLLLASALAGCAHGAWLGTAPALAPAPTVEAAVSPLLARMPPGAERDVVVTTAEGTFAVELRSGFPLASAPYAPDGDPEARARALLTPAERALTDDVPVVRTPGEGIVAAAYVHDGGGRRIELHDRALALDERLFCGTPDAPERHSVRTLLHEFAHAIQAYAPARLRARFRAVGPRSPTTLGDSVDEAMAEAFSLYKCDPEALRRVAPRQHRFFARGRHLP